MYLVHQTIFLKFIRITFYTKCKLNYFLQFRTVLKNICWVLFGKIKEKKIQHCSCTVFSLQNLTRLAVVRRVNSHSLLFLCRMSMRYPLCLSSGTLVSEAFETLGLQQRYSTIIFVKQMQAITQYRCFCDVLCQLAWTSFDKKERGLYLPVIFE